MFRVGCGGVERLVLPPPFAEFWGQSISVGVGWILVHRIAHGSILCCPFPAQSQPSSLCMLFWTLFSVHVKQCVCPLLRKNSLFKKQSCGYEVAYLS